MYKKEETVSIRRTAKWTVKLAFPAIILCLFIAGSTVVCHGKASADEKNSDYHIRFDNAFVEEGVPLGVSGAPEGISYHWTITGADGTQETFTTSENEYTPSDNDLEKLITVTVEGNDETKAEIYYSRLPVLYIENEAGYYGVGDEYSEAAMRMQGNASFDDRDELYSGNIRIKLRGNSTKLREKRPFTIKLDKKADLLGMGESKHWVLLANDIDHTLMRNKILYDFSGAIGMKPYMQSEYAVLIFNGAYYGVYQLCEKVDIEENRVDIYDWEEAAEDAAEAITNMLYASSRLTREEAALMEDSLEEALQTDLSWITEPYTFSYDADTDGREETYVITDYVDLPDATGGALLEMDFYAFDGRNPSTLITAYSQPIYFKTPKYAITNNTLFGNVYKGVQAFEYALHSTDFIYHEEDTRYQAQNRSGGFWMPGYEESGFTAPEYDGAHYSELFDMDSLIQNFLVCELSMNWDGMKNSVFFYKDIDGLFQMGPVWDFDWAWGNINMFNTNTWYPTSWHTTIPAFTVEQYYQKVQWNRCLIRDPYFIIRVYEKYHEIRSTLIEDIVREGGIIDSYEDKLREAAAANDARWEHTYASYRSVGFEKSISNMRRFITQRLAWMDQQFADPDTLIKSLGYYEPSEEMQVTQIDNNIHKGYTRITAKSTASDIKYITFQINGACMIKSEVVDGQAICEIPDSELIKGKDRWNVVQLLAGTESGEYIINKADEGNYYNALSNYAVFYSGDSFNVNNPEEGGNTDSEVSGSFNRSDIGADSSNADILRQADGKEAQATAGGNVADRKISVAWAVIIITAGLSLVITIILMVLRGRKKTADDPSHNEGPSEGAG